MRVRTSLIAAFVASLVALGACQREPEPEALMDEAPPAETADIERVELAGGPSADTEATARQASDDAFVARLESRGLMVTRKTDASGKSVLVISNRPVPNPVLFGGPRTRVAKAPRRERLAGTIGGGVRDSRPAATTGAAAGAVASTAAPAPTAPAPEAPATETAAATAAPAPSGRIETADGAPVQVADPARAGFEMSPMMWGIAGVILAALLLLLFLANRPKKPQRRYSSHEVPPEASGGGEAHA